MSSTGPLSGQIVVVTGASRGIGRAIAASLAEAGATLALGGRDLTALGATREAAEAAGAEAHAAALDVCSDESVEAFVGGTLERFGRIDVLVNNAGVLTQGGLLEAGLTPWHRAIDTNLFGLVRMTYAVGGHLVEQGHGKVVNVASNFAFKGVPRHAAYAASKAAIVSFTKSIALEWARENVQVNAVAPGVIETDLNADVRTDGEMTAKILRTIPVRHFGTVDDVARLVLPLCDPRTTFVTGSVVTIDGGETAR